MTIRFVAAESPTGSRRLSKHQVRATISAPANDNGAHVQLDTMLHAALQQFAQHGIGAAAHARNQAERAFFAGDRETYQWWLDICRTLDRRLADSLVQKAEG